MPGKGWTSGMKLGGRRRVRTLTNNPQRGSSNWGGFVSRGFGKLSVRRLMKVDPANAQGTPDSQLLVGTNGVDGRTGATGVQIVGGIATKTTKGSGGGDRKAIRDRGANKSLKKR